MRRLKALIGVVALCLTAAPAVAGAQQEIDNVEERLPEDQGLTDKTAVPIGVEARDKEQAGEAPLGSFVLTAVDISGASAISPETFAPLYDGLLAQYVTLEDVAALAEAITKLYRDKGYILSRALIPPQNAAGGVLRVEIVEGYIDEILIEGDATPDIRKRLAAVAADRPLRMKTLERTLSLISDLSGVAVKSSKIEPDSGNLARHHLIVEIAQDRFEAGLYADNRGTEDAGVLQTYVSVAANSVLRTGDQIAGGVFFTPEDPNELVLGQISYEAPLGRSGTVMRASVMTSYFDAGGPREATEAESRTKRVNVSLTYPVIRRRNFTMWTSAGFEGRNFEEEQFGAVRFNDKVRSVYASVTLRKSHLKGVTSFSGGATRGLGVLNASAGGALSRPDATGEFTKFTAEFGRLQNLGGNFSVYASAAAQLSLDPLLASEEFSLGGARYGRAYDYGEFKGDDGVAASVELRYSGQPDIAFLQSYQLYGFYDFGAVWKQVRRL